MVLYGTAFISDRYLARHLSTLCRYICDICDILQDWGEAGVWTNKPQDKEFISRSYADHPFASPACTGKLIFTKSICTCAKRFKDAQHKFCFTYLHKHEWSTHFYCFRYALYEYITIFLVHLVCITPMLSMLWYKLLWTHYHFTFHKLTYAIRMHLNLICTK